MYKNSETFLATIEDLGAKTMNKFMEDIIAKETCVLKWISHVFRDVIHLMDIRGGSRHILLFLVNISVEPVEPVEKK